MLSWCSTENQEEVGYSKADNDIAYNNGVSMSEYVSYTAKVNLKSCAYGQVETALSNNTPCKQGVTMIVCLYSTLFYVLCFIYFCFVFYGPVGLK